MVRPAWPLVLAVVLTLASAACGSGEDRPGIVTADEEPSTTITAPRSAPPAVDYVPSSDVAVDRAVADDVTRLRQLVARRTVDWETVSEVWHRGPDRLADLPEPTQLVDDAVAGRLGEPDDVRRVRVEKGLDVLIAIRVREELAEADAAIGARDEATHDVDQASVYLEATDALRAVRDTVEPGLVRARDAVGDDDRAALTAAAVAVERAFDAFFYRSTLDALRPPDSDTGLAAAETSYMAISAKVEGVEPTAHEQVKEAFAARDAVAARKALERAPVRQVLAS